MRSLIMLSEQQIKETIDNEDKNTDKTIICTPNLSVAGITQAIECIKNRCASVEMNQKEFDEFKKYVNTDGGNLEWCIEENIKAPVLVNNDIPNGYVLVVAKNKKVSPSIIKIYNYND